ncbi:hypothetical protein BV898_17102 [Hypsibius exemplaris]|uniref:Uncharacterized protein n=1 Tax=Hypsibius exemplaris TaxID=2072580 RepID=A0A9X6RM45_HYPEX|nr:hypothetical protein BV898_17102 [Hypsibius exemplaris]
MRRIWTITLWFILLSFCTIIALIAQYERENIPSPSSANVKSVTVVTAYYLFKSKHPHKQYLEWMKNFLAFIPCHLLVFTDSLMLPLVRTLRRPHLEVTRFRVRNLTDFYMAKKGADFWAHQRSLDPEQKRPHTEQLYIMWNEKFKLVTEAIARDDFGSDYFVWCDIGSFRTPKQMRALRTFPNAEKVNQLAPEKLYYLQTGPFNETDYVMRDEDGLPEHDFQLDIRLGGTVIVGHRDAWRRWDAMYYEVLERMAQSGRFVGKDQNVMASVAVMQPDMVGLIQPEPFFGGTGNIRPFIIHFVWIENRRSQQPFDLTALQYLSFLSAIHHAPPPTVIWFHTNGHFDGPYWEAVKGHVTVRAIRRYTEAGGRPVKVIEQEADLVKLDVAIQHGGFFVDFDVFFTGPLDAVLEKLRGYECVFRAVANGRWTLFHMGNFVCNPGSGFLKEIYRDYNEDYRGSCFNPVAQVYNGCLYAYLLWMKNATFQRSVYMDKGAILGQFEGPDGYVFRLGPRRLAWKGHVNIHTGDEQRELTYEDVWRRQSSFGDMLRELIGRNRSKNRLTDAHSHVKLSPFIWEDVSESVLQSEEISMIRIPSSHPDVPFSAIRQLRSELGRLLRLILFNDTKLITQNSVHKFPCEN